MFDDLMSWAKEGASEGAFLPEFSHQIPTFQDKTFTDNKGVLCQEPVLITLGIFNRETRNRTDAWRPIGFVPNMDLLELSKNTTEKMSDYHVIVNHIMSKLFDMQEKKGIR